MLHVLHIITGLNDGGAEGVLFRLCEHDRNNFHTVVSMMDEGKYGPLLKKTQLYCLGCPRTTIRIAALFRLWRILRDERPDLIQTWMYHSDLIGGLVAKFSRVQFVCWGIRNGELDALNSRKSTRIIARLCGYLSFLLPEKIICCAEKACSTHVRMGYSASKMVVVPNGYDVDRYRIEEAVCSHVRREMGIDLTIPLIGMVARYDPQKDHFNLLGALRIIIDNGRNFRCVLVGEGMDVNNRELFEQITKFGLGDNILLVGQRSDIPAIMNAIDVHVLSSCYGEAFPNVVAEAMACGTPCVVTDVGDAGTIVGETGWVVRPGNSQELGAAMVAALEEMASNQGKWLARRLQARARIVENYSLEKMLEGFNRQWLAVTGTASSV